jgi:hypothetical protein
MTPDERSIPLIMAARTAQCGKASIDGAVTSEAEDSTQVLHGEGGVNHLRGSSVGSVG